MIRHLNWIEIGRDRFFIQYLCECRQVATVVRRRSRTSYNASVARPMGESVSSDKVWRNRLVAKSRVARWSCSTL